MNLFSEANTLEKGRDFMVDSSDFLLALLVCQESTFGSYIFHDMHVRNKRVDMEHCIYSLRMV